MTIFWFEGSELSLHYYLTISTLLCIIFNFFFATTERFTKNFSMDFEDMFGFHNLMKK